MGQQLWALTPIQRTRFNSPYPMRTHNCLQLKSQRLFLLLWAQAHTWYTDIHTAKYPYTLPKKKTSEGGSGTVLSFGTQETAGHRWWQLLSWGKFHLCRFTSKKEKTWVPRQSLSCCQGLRYCPSLSIVSLAAQAVSTLPWRAGAREEIFCSCLRTAALGSLPWGRV